MNQLIAKTMLYIAGLSHNIWGVLVDTIEVDEHQVEEYLAQGWFRSPFEVRDAQAAPAPVQVGNQTFDADGLKARILELETALSEQIGKTDLAIDAFEDSERARQELAKALDAANAATTAALASASNAPKAPTPEEVEQALRIELAEKAEKLGVKIDGRWNSTKIQAALDKAAAGA